MPVNTAALKTFAPAMRRQLLEAVGRKLDLLLNSQTPDTLSTYARQIAELRAQEGENRDQLLERVAYTWFNRLCALRYLDARGWHPFGCKVLMPAAEGETQPELLKLMRAGSLPAALKGHTNESRLHGLLDEQIQTAIAGADPQGEVYRELVLSTCRFYHELLHNLFEGLDDASELLLPDDLLSEGSIAGGFRREISDDDCQDVEILGWLYQFYIAEKKDEVMARKKAVPTEDIPAVTQLFTPHWIVRYLVENSLGRLWLLNRPGSKLREQMPYYIEGETETEFLKISKPEEIKLLDPACGSGHILTYAFDLLTLIYEEEGYAPSEIPGLILQHNLSGLEICPRAAQLAELALVLKGREKSRRFLQPEQLVRPRIIELQNLRFQAHELNNYIEALDLGELFDHTLFKLLRQFEEAQAFGSLIQPCLNEQEVASVRLAMERKNLDDQIFLRETHRKVLRVLNQAETLTQKYHVIAANPPYMGGKGMNPVVKQFLQENFADYKSDLFAGFIARSLTLTLSKGFLGFMTPFVWMFISSYEKLRARLIVHATITSLVQLEYSGFDGATVPICAFSLQNSRQKGFLGGYVRLSDFRGSENQGPRTLEAISNPQCGWFFRADSDNFRRIPGSPIAYWATASIREVFEAGTPLGSKSEPRVGLQTGENARFVRCWHEVDSEKMGFLIPSREEAAKSLRKWFPYNKGGDFRRWYGNQEFVVDWERDGSRVRNFKFQDGSPRSYIRNSDRYFSPSISWSKISSGLPAFRFFPQGFIFDVAGTSVFSNSHGESLDVLGFANSLVAQVILKTISPTLNFEVGHIASLPLLPDPRPSSHRDLIESLVSLARIDWNNFEASWDFARLPLLNSELKGQTLATSWRNWELQSAAAIRRMQELETENNSLYIAAYGLNGELKPEVPEDQITLACAEQRKDIGAFLSYAIGCMMGRYSLDQPGLILADSRDSQAAQLAAYEEKVGKPLSEVEFRPDADAIIPVLDGEWFEDDIVARTREFLEVTFPESTVTDNLRFIEESLGKDIRKYFCSDFYKDHLQTYKKRPIYWMVQSPKKGFACLIYLHRYTKDTLNQVLNNYFRPYLQKLEARLAQLGLDQLNDGLPTRERTAARKEAEKITKVLKECEAWEQDALLPLAQQRIELDLDDGVKVNYLKLQDVLAPIPGLAAKED
ncbi:BREX-1 system adenine-specific DNA-methyltransferase PglX [Synechococcus sp. CBW1002]|uniref:BREX-1 system adenine-specific DNA-methyltransferase PglX n=1 Tax=Synechococcus sp. CBW1002 TaxID=1353134 RepID=UPI0018CF590F|nr:BREX-1 system adenine-specific DNA-methyltransferase PglX [Synechococcus sp. CBW1002]QPN59733.1 BREX-1 system adenine-specific DNA-methyltransferase PglX [Synechococcus sp. CBW1002]